MVKVMAKVPQKFDDEIDLIELIRIFLNHKSKYILLGLLGFLLGLGFTYHHEPRYKTTFKYYIGHPIFTYNTLLNSEKLQELLNTSAVNNNYLPNYHFNKKSKIFTVITTKDNIKEEVTEILKQALVFEIDQVKRLAQNLESFDNKQEIFSINNNITWTNQDIAKIDADEVVKSLKLSFGKTQALYPKPVKHSVIGIFIGLLLAFGWMLFMIIRSNMLKQSRTESWT